MPDPLPRLIADLYLALSRDRLETYRPEGGDDLEMLTAYFWNIDLAEALVPSLHAAELALRNGLHNALTARYGTDMWFYHPDVVAIWQRIGGDQIRQRDRVRERIEKNRHFTAARLVAGSEFGFWVALLADRYQRPLWQPDKFALLKAVFPHAPRLSRKDAHNRYHAIQRLRNRVFHYEAVWHRPRLLQEHGEIHETIAWISPTLHRAIHAVDNFPTIHAGRADVQRDLVRRLEIR